MATSSLHLPQLTTDEEARARDIVNHLSPDCRDHVFVFLSLFDCLRFAETSRTSLEHVISEVDRRRHEQFLVRPCEEYTATRGSRLPYIAIRTSALPPRDTLLTHNHEDNDSSKNSFLYRIPVDDINGNHKEFPQTSIWYALPSVLERIESLYRAIPGTHPFNDDLRNLVLDLKKKEEGRTQNITTTTTGKNDTLLERFSTITYSHRLHASLLSRCTVNLNPDPYVYNQKETRNANAGSDDKPFTVTLERYMGDVLTASCLVGHTYHYGNTINHSGKTANGDSAYGMNYDREDYGSKARVVVEGGYSLDQWLYHLNSLITNVCDSSTASTVKISSTMGWYQYYVFLHSAVLRISPFTIQQAEQLSCVPMSGLLEPRGLFNGAAENGDGDGNNNNGGDGNIDNVEERSDQEQHPHHQPWFLPSLLYSCLSPGRELSKFIMIDRMRGLFSSGNHHRAGVLETTLNHFGPLGRFRGRDRVATHCIYPTNLYLTMVRNQWFSRSRYMEEVQVQDQIDHARSWLSDSDSQKVVQWMKLLQDQSQRTRPMTVKPPLVTIRMRY